MAKIPSAADLPEARVARSRTPSASELAYGAGQAKGVQNIGASLDKIGDALSKSHQLAFDRQQKLDDATYLLQAEESFNDALSQEFRRTRTEADYSDYKTVEGFTKYAEDARTKALTVPMFPNGNPQVSEAARIRLQDRLSSIERIYSSKAQDAYISARTAKGVDTLNAAINRQANGVLRAPDMLDTSLALVESQVNEFEGVFDANDIRDHTAQSKRMLIGAAVDGYLEKGDITNARRVAKDGRFDDLFTPAQRGQFEAKVDAREKALKAETEKQRTVDKNLLLRQVDDHLASIRDHGQGIEGFAERATGLMDEREYADLLKGEARALRVHEAAGDMTLATPDRIAETVDRFRPKAGSETYEDDRQVYDSLRRRGDDILKARKEDSAGYALATSPRLKLAWDATRQQGTPEEIRLRGEAYAQQSLAEQEALGVPESERRILPKAVAAGIVADLTSPKGAERAADTIETLANQFGRHWGQAYRDLVKEKLPGEFVVLSSIGDGPQDAAVRKRLAQAIKAGRATLTQPLASTDKTEIDRTVQSALAPWAKLERARPGTRTAQNVAAMGSSAELLAYDNAARGMSASDAANAAVKSLVEDRYEILDGGNFALYVPQGLGGTVTEAGTQILRDLKPADVMDPGADPSGPPLTEAQRRENYAAMVKSRGLWVLNDDKTALLLDHLGLPVLVDDGEGNYVPMTFSFTERPLPGDGGKRRGLGLSARSPKPAEPEGGR